MRPSDASVAICNMPRRYRAQRRIKKKKSVWKSAFFWRGLLLGVVFSTLGYTVLFSDLFQIRYIEISGARKLPERELRQFVEDSIKRDFKFFEINSILAVDTGTVEEKLREQFLRVKDVDISRRLFHTVQAKIQERKAVALWCKDRDMQVCFSLDDDGVIFEEREASEFLPIFLFPEASDRKLGENIIDEETLQSLLETWKTFGEFQLFQARGLRIAFYEILSPTRAHAKTSEDWDIYFNPQEDMDWQMAKLRVVFEKYIFSEQRPKLEYIELRFGNQAFVKYQD